MYATQQSVVLSGECQTSHGHSRPLRPTEFWCPLVAIRGAVRAAEGRLFPERNGEALDTGRGLFLSSPQLDHIKADAWAGKFLWSGWYIFFFLEWVG